MPDQALRRRASPYFRRLPCLKKCWSHGGLNVYAEGEVVRHSKASRVRGVGEGSGEYRGARRGRREHHRVREQGEVQPLQAMEPDEFGKLLSWAGAGGGDTEGLWSRGPFARRAECGRSSFADCGSDAARREA